MAYAAIISLADTITRILNHHMFSISLQEKEQIIPLLEHVNSFQGFLEELPDKFNSLEERMREVAHVAENILEYNVLKKVSSSSDEQPELQLERMMGEMDLIARKVEKIKGSSSSKDVERDDHPSSRSTSSSASAPPILALECKSKSSAHSWTKQMKSRIINTRFYSFFINLRFQPARALECVRPRVQGGVNSSVHSSSPKNSSVHSSSSNASAPPKNSSVHSSSSNASAPPKNEDTMVGFEDYALHVKGRLCAKESKLQVIPICGMGGIGKTTLAKNVYDDPLILETFDIRVWVTVSQDYSKESILSSLLDSLKEFDTGRLGETDEEKAYKILKYRKYLVVMDDIWSSEAWDVVRRVYPDDGNRSRVLLTTRLSNVASYPDSSSKLCEMQLMDEYQSWNLFKRKVFGYEDCPSEIENTGKEIARRCKGLPLAIVVIAGVVSTVSRNLASWQEIAQNVKKSADQNQIEDILALSYFHLPQYLRPCFLYMGSFPEDEQINVTKLIRLWVSEGFLKSPAADFESFEEVAEECLEELVKRNLVLVTRRKWDGRIRSCRLHDMMRDLCIRKAHESMFFLDLKKEFTTNIKNQRRVSIKSHNLRHLLRYCSSTIRSIRCWQYDIEDMESSLGSVGLLRVFDAATVIVDFSSLMKQVFELFHLRYLAISYSGSDLSGLSNLQNLQTLYIHRFADARIGAEADEITRDLWLDWCMPHLRHVYLRGVIHFCDPEETTCSLGSLQTVSYVSHRCCTERILKKIPNLKKLKVDCSGGRHHGKAACLNDLVHLHRLESLEIYAGRFYQSRPKYYNLNYPKMLKKLILRVLVLPWDNIVISGSLPNLRVLKLMDCICVGGTWATTEEEYPKLEFLMIKDCDFRNWITESSHFPKLRRLQLHSCWCLNAIPNDIGEIPTLELIEVKGDSRKSLVKSAKEIRNEQDDLGNNALQVICDDKSFGSSDFDEITSGYHDSEEWSTRDDNDDDTKQVLNDDDENNF